MYLIYTAALGLGLVLVFPYYALRFRKYLPALPERLGFVRSLSGNRPVWIHAVSVGELRAVDPLIRSIRELRGRQPIVISTTTATGRALALERRDVDQVIYFPFDLPSMVARTLERLDPERVIVAETEIWPNFLRQCSRCGVPVYLLNGRISDRSFPRYRVARRWLGRVLGGYTLLGMQSETDASRIRELGAPRDRVVVFGNMKYDAGLPAEEVEPSLRQVLEHWRPLVIAASTAEGEEQLVLDAFRQLRAGHPKLRLLIAPRRRERFNEVARSIRDAGFRACRRSALSETCAEGEVLLLDSIGELNGVFRFASVVFMGGTLVPRGGHNILEAVRFGKPVVFGPHMDNFRDMARDFLDRGAALQVSGTNDLAEQLDRLLSEPALSESMSVSASRLLEANRGATSLALKAIFPPEDRSERSKPEEEEEKSSS